MIELIHVGFGNYVAASRIVAISEGTSTPIRRMWLEAKKRGLVYDFTGSRKKRTVLFLDTGQMVLSAISTSTIALRSGMIPVS